ncbi:OsmC family protein [Massilia glaciei]|uniref:OsmC family peroxiredoxin n=1 Tax=Massilia glaciei TaxID=1524097 RepID=A0A2U2HAW1_9BURK|nr:OsmC family protein [Massilia glaciei]PWF39922.1 OsmC family peroxiredoxin [Massilia glaciei]
MPITVTRDLSQPMRHIVHIRGHEFPVDVSADQGGTDSGPGAHDLYDAALASCKALTVVWYARRKGIALDDVRVEIERDASEERHGIYRLHTRLHLSGDLSEAQRQELLAAAGKCPIHKLMSTAATEITTSLA